VRLRTLAAVAAAALALTGLAGCRTNVGTAATVDGHRITETDVNRYITPNARPVTERKADQTTTQVSPKTFVVQEVIYDRLFLKILAKIPGAPTPARIDAQLDSARKGKTYTQQAESLGLKGYTEAFYKIVLRVELIKQGLSSEQQAGVDVNSIVTKLHFGVTVSPRYGTWDRKTFSLIAGAAVPGYLTVQPGGSGGAANQPAG
jgi:hypothetical protein